MTMHVIEYPAGLDRYAEIVNGDKRAIVWRRGVVSLYQDGVGFLRSTPIRSRNLKRDGIAMAKGAVR